MTAEERKRMLAAIFDSITANGDGVERVRDGGLDVLDVVDVRTRTHQSGGTLLVRDGGLDVMRRVA